MSVRPHIFTTLLLLIIVCSGCQNRKPPYAPREALNTFHLPPGFRIELVAAEPEVVDPVAMAFDERGRLFVVEMPDYPFGKQRGRIKLLEDKDGDGRFETSTVFAEDLSFPNGVMPWQGGVLVTAAPDILYLADRDGDHRAELRQVVLNGFAALNPQLRVNGLLYGIDNWIYVAYPKFGPPSRYVKEFGDMGKPIRFPNHTEVAAVDPFAKGMDLRFKLDPAKAEPIAGNSQYGNAFDAWGNRFTVWNNDHVRHVVLQNQYLVRNPYLGVESTMHSLSDHGNAATVYPITERPLHIHESEIGHFTSACGICVYEGGEFPAEYRRAFFVCEPVHNLVHCDRLIPSGATFLAKRALENREFLSSTDSWFRPVFTTIGPDGALYVVDFYRKIIEHPEWMPPEMMNEADLYAGSDRGRIYRIVYGADKPKSKPKLNEASLSELVQQLSNRNMWWRTTAQRLLVERRAQSALPALQDLARKGTSPEPRLHGLWTIEGLDALDTELVLHALDDEDAGVREQALRLAERYLANVTIKNKLLGMVNDPSERVRFQLACTLGQLPHSEAFAALESIALRHIEDPWFQIAVLTAASDNATRWLRSVTEKPDFVKEPSKGKEQFLRRTTSIIGARKREHEVAEVLAFIAQTSNDGAAWWQAASLDGLATRLKRGSDSPIKLSPKAQQTLIKLLQVGPPNLRKSALQLAANVSLYDSKPLRAILSRASETAVRENAGLEARVQALALLGLDPTGAACSILERALTPKQPEPIQLAAAKALLTRPDRKAMDFLLDNWTSFTTRVKDMVLGEFLSDRRRVPVLLEAIEAGKVAASSLSPAGRSQLLRFHNEEIRQRAKTLFANLSRDDRKKVLDAYRAALRMPGNVDRGRDVFKQFCSKCHKIGNVGFEVGPDLASLTNRTREDLLRQILDPNAYVAPGYEAYLVETTDGRLITGVIAKETETTVVLRRSEGEEDIILRSHIVSLRSSNVSLMPENLETGITVEAMADLLQYLKGLGSNR